MSSSEYLVGWFTSIRELPIADLFVGDLADGAVGEAILDHPADQMLRDGIEAHLVGDRHHHLRPGMCGVADVAEALIRVSVSSSGCVFAGTSEVTVGDSSSNPAAFAF